MTRRRWWLLVGLALLIWGGLEAYVLRWVSDDAFISFRYARNLVEGHGLVFNPGERVEGYTNPLWTLWIAAGLRIGIPAELWANIWGIAFYLGSIALLVAECASARRDPPTTGAWPIPVAALGAAAHHDWAVWATGGLETSMFAFLLLIGFRAAARESPSTLAATLAGAAMALATLTRHDGLLPAAALGVCLAVRLRSRPKPLLGYGIAFAVAWVPFTLWRIGYYGDFFPNTYYAKSAYLAWYEQGWHYLALYLERYWVLLLGPVLLVASAVARRRHPGRSSAWFDRRVVMAAAIALPYTFYVVRVGGDFMFARLLVPVTPFYLLLLEYGMGEVFRSRPSYRYAATALVLAGLLFTPAPVTGTEWRHGIADEREYYSGDRIAILDRTAEVLSRYFDGLAVRVAIYGDEARLAYRARFPVAIESHSGLTDPEVARTELSERGRVGHEKHASAEYLIEERRAHFTFSSVPGKQLGLSRYIPEVIVQFEGDVYGRVLHWDPRIMAALGERGARIPDFLGSLDGYIASLDRMPDEQVARVFALLQRFYFDPVRDPDREEAFRRRLNRGGS